MPMKRSIYVINKDNEVVVSHVNHIFKNSNSAATFIKMLEKKNPDCVVNVNKPLLSETKINNMRNKWFSFQESGGSKQEFINMVLGEDKEEIELFDEVEDEDYKVSVAYAKNNTDSNLIAKALGFNDDEMRAESWIWAKSGSTTSFENYLEVKYKTRWDVMVMLNRYGTRLAKGNDHTAHKERGKKK